MESLWAHDKEETRAKLAAINSLFGKKSNKNENKNKNKTTRQANGRIHIIDGLLAEWPALTAPQAQPLDILDTLKQCDKFDGFVTLAEGTGLASILKQGEFYSLFSISFVGPNQQAAGRPAGRLPARARSISLRRRRRRDADLFVVALGAGERASERKGLRFRLCLKDNGPNSIQITARRFCCSSGRASERANVCA